VNKEYAAKRMGDYEILELLGVGGMGKVFKARNVISNRVEALKIILPDLADRQDSAERFLREIQLLASLDHPNIASLRTAFTMDNQLVMAMEFVEGVTLSARLKKGPIPVEKAIDCINQALDALGYAHDRHIIHRDVKPANMMLTPQGVLKLMDFGIARVEDAPGMTKTGFSLGSLGYMSPEQIKGERVDARSDLYAVAASLYEFVTGKSPFQGDNAHAIMTAHMKNDPTPPIKVQPDLPKVLNDTILRGMATDPNDRFQSADDFRNVLKHVLQDHQDHKKEDCSDKTRLDDPTGNSPFVKPEKEPVIDPMARVSGPTTPPPLCEEPITPHHLHVEKTGRSSRGLYMTLGAIAIVAVIAVVFFFKYGGLSEVEDPPNPSESVEIIKPPSTSPKDSAPPPPADSPVETPNIIGEKVADYDGHSSTEIPVPASPQKQREPKLIARLSTPPKDSAPTARVADDVDKEELNNLENQLIKLSSRATTLRGSLDRLRKEQNDQGYNLRPDIATAAELMTTYLDRAQLALRARDIGDVRRYMESAEPEVKKLERFFGRR